MGANSKANHNLLNDSLFFLFHRVAQSEQNICSSSSSSSQLFLFFELVPLINTFYPHHLLLVLLALRNCLKLIISAQQRHKHPRLHISSLSELRVISTISATVFLFDWQINDLSCKYRMHNNKHLSQFPSTTTLPCPGSIFNPFYHPTPKQRRK